MLDAAPWNGTVGWAVPVGATTVELPVGYMTVVVAVVVGISVADADVAGAEVAGAVGTGRVTPTERQSCVAKARVSAIEVISIDNPFAVLS